MNSQTELSQQDLLFNLIKWTDKSLLSKYNGVFSKCPNVREELDVIVGMMNLAVNEINRLTNEK
jgi:hypothetical protein